MSHKNWYEYFTKEELREIIVHEDEKVRRLIKLLEENDAYFTRSAVAPEPSEVREEMLKEFSKETANWVISQPFPPFRLFKDYVRRGDE